MNSQWEQCAPKCFENNNVIASIQQGKEQILWSYFHYCKYRIILPRKYQQRKIKWSYYKMRTHTKKLNKTYVWKIYLATFEKRKTANKHSRSLPTTPHSQASLKTAAFPLDHFKPSAKISLDLPEAEKKKGQECQKLPKSSKKTKKTLEKNKKNYSTNHPKWSKHSRAPRLHRSCAVVPHKAPGVVNPSPRKTRPPASEQLTQTWQRLGGF